MDESRRRLALLRKANNPAWLEAAEAGQTAGLTGLFLEHALEVRCRQHEALADVRRREREMAERQALWEASPQAHYQRYVYEGEPGEDGVYWQQRRAERIRLDGGRCCRCGQVAERVVVHHLHYDTVGQEAMEDLRTVCDPCHLEIHLDSLWYRRDDEWITVTAAGAIENPPEPEKHHLFPF